MCVKMTKKMTYSFYIGGENVDKLTEKQKQAMADRLSETMSLYYSAHPEEYSKIKGE